MNWFKYILNSMAFPIAYPAMRLRGERDTFGLGAVMLIGVLLSYLVIGFILKQFLRLSTKTILIGALSVAVVAYLITMPPRKKKRYYQDGPLVGKEIPDYVLTQPKAK